MSEDPCQHNYLVVNKELDNQFEICKKCRERKYGLRVKTFFSKLRNGTIYV